MPQPRSGALLQEILWGSNLGGALWPFQPLGFQYLRPLHLHSQPELFVMRQGSLELRIGAERFAMQRGMVALIPPSVEHITQGLSADADFWVLQPESSLVEAAFARSAPASTYGQVPPPSWLIRLLGLVPDPPVFVASAADFRILEECAQLAWQSYLSAARAAPAVDPRFEWIPAWTSSSARQARELMLTMWVEALRIVQRQHSGVKPRLARGAFDLMTSDASLSRTELCERLGVSEGHLSRTFPDQYGASLNGQRARLRLMAFLAQLKSRSNNANMLSASLNAGFGSYAQLYRVFDQYSSYSPSEYVYGGGALHAATIRR